MGRLIYYAIIVYLILLVLKFFRNLGRRPSPPGQTTGSSGAMVKDDSCQTYLPRENAIHDVIDGRDRYFCSKECRTKFLEERKRQRRAGEPR